MPKLAVIKTGGKQYVVEEGQTVSIEKLPEEEGSAVTFDEVLLVAQDGEHVTVGQPTVDSAQVTGTVAEQGKEGKVIVFKKKPKKRYEKKQGHRQPYTKVTIDTISV